MTAVVRVVGEKKPPTLSLLAARHGREQIVDLQAQPDGEISLEGEGLGEVVAGVKEVDGRLWGDLAEDMQKNDAVGLTRGGGEDSFAIGPIGVDSFTYAGEMSGKVSHGAGVTQTRPGRLAPRPCDETPRLGIVSGTEQLLDSV